MPDSVSIAGAEVAETLRSERDRFEMSLADLRIAGYAVTASASGLLALLVERPANAPAISSWGPVVYLFTGAAIAAGIRGWVRREGATPRVIYLVVVFDLVFVSLVSMLVTTIVPFTDASDPDGGTNWGRHTVGAGLMFMLALNSMRSHEASARLALFLALGLYLANVAFYGPEPPHSIGFSLVLLMGVMGIRIAGQQKRVLDRFARSRLLRRFLPTAGVSAVEEGSDPYAVGTRTVTVTMIVTDLRGFTAMSEKLAPEVMVAQLNAYHGAMYEEIEGHGGMLEKFMGDGALAVFGWPSAADCGAGAAVACGHAMLARLQRVNVERAAAGDPPLAMGIGIHTGQVIAGAIGAPGRRVEFTFLGDAVNLASRIEGLTKSMAKPLLVSADTVSRLRSTEGLVELGASEIRGRVEPVRLWGRS